MSKEKKVVDNKKTTKKTTTTAVEKDKVVETGKGNNIVIVTIIVVAVLAVLLLINFFTGGFNSNIDVDKDIKSVKKILNEKYDEIDCIDYSCNYIVATTGDSLKETSYTVFDLSGKKIAKYSINYSKKNVAQTRVVAATKNYIITRVMTDKKTSYTLRSTTGKALYSSGKEIVAINDNYASVLEGEKEYTIIDSKGKTKYSKVKNYNTYSEGDYISLNVNDKNIILDKKGNKVLTNYKVVKEVLGKNTKTLYLIVEDTKNDGYYYFDINKNKKVGESFVNYTSSDTEGELIISKRVNKDLTKYRLYKNGKQEKISEGSYASTSVILEKIKENVDSEKYFIYSYGLTSEKQTYVFVNDKEGRTFGVLNVKKNAYKKLFELSPEKLNSYASISSLDNDGDSILRVSCTTSNCPKEQALVYNLTKNKEIYVEKNDAVISNYIQYKNNYKVIKYSYLSSNSDLKGQYVLYDNKDKELFKSESAIVLVDSKIEFGLPVSSHVILYSASNKKTINDEDTKADKITLNGNIMYKYTDKDGKTIICTDSGKKVVETDSSNYLTYSNANIVYMNDNKISIYNSDRNKTKSYKLKNNEKLNGLSNDIVAPYRGTVFINNSNNKEVKILNSKAKVIRKIKGAELVEVKKNSRKGVALIVVKKDSKNKDIYGLYIAK